jgi:hypothetical protein
VFDDDVLEGHQPCQVGLGVFFDEFLIERPELIELNTGKIDPRPSKDSLYALFILFQEIDTRARMF